MFKFLNGLWFFGGLLRRVAKLLVPTAPQWKEFRDANKRDVLLTELQKEVNEITNVEKETQQARLITEQLKKEIDELNEQIKTIKTQNNDR